MRAKFLHQQCSTLILGLSSTMRLQFPHRQCNTPIPDSLAHFNTDSAGQPFHYSLVLLRHSFNTDSSSNPFVDSLAHAGQPFRDSLVPLRHSFNIDRPANPFVDSLHSEGIFFYISSAARRALDNLQQRGHICHTMQHSHHWTVQDSEASVSTQTVLNCLELVILHCVDTVLTRTVQDNHFVTVWYRCATVLT
ncbi:hypothetical protein BaRGS_00012341 [Batillaria attramentaria]|uniref:Uncharacterized protein n=1 Tax=Batillaria attramentaria TaxID=370345 RepID=A0ABD0LBA9_9CAEN